MIGTVFYLCLLCAIYTICRVIMFSNQTKKQKVLTAIAILFCFMIPTIISINANCYGEVYRVLTIIGYFLFVLVLGFFFIILLRDVILGLHYIFETRKKTSVPKCYVKNKKLIQKTNKMAFILSLVICVFASYQGLKAPLVAKEVISSEKVNAEISIAVLSDMHITRRMSAKSVQKIVKQVNALNPDVIVLTGDVVDDDIFFVEKALLELKNLTAKEGVFVVSGNHEFDRNYEQVKEAFKTLGLSYLKNEGVSLKNNYYLGGIPDLGLSARRKEGLDIRRAFKSSDKGDFRILLSHRPAVVNDQDYYGIDLTIAGHTHGGQFFPLHIITYLKNAGFVSGFYELPKSLLYVSNGVGQSGPQMRWFAPSEISFITIRPMAQNAAQSIDKSVTKEDVPEIQKEEKGLSQHLKPSKVEENNNQSEKEIVYPAKKKEVVSSKEFVDNALENKENVVSRLKKEKELADKEALTQIDNEVMTKSDLDFEEAKASISNAFEGALLSKTQKDLKAEKEKTKALEIELNQLRVDFEKNKRSTEKVLIRQRSIIRYLEEEREALQEALQDQKMLLETERAETQEMLEAQRKLLLREQEISKQAFNLQRELMAELTAMKAELEKYRQSRTVDSKGANYVGYNQVMPTIRPQNDLPRVNMNTPVYQNVQPQKTVQMPEYKTEERFANMEVVYLPDGGVKRTMTKTVVVEYPTHFSTVKSVASYTTSREEEARINPLSIENALRKSLNLPLSI